MHERDKRAHRTLVRSRPTGGFIELTSPRLALCPHLLTESESYMYLTYAFLVLIRSLYYDHVIDSMPRQVFIVACSQIPWITSSRMKGCVRSCWKARIGR